MLNRSASLWLGIAFVLIGAINVWLILQASALVRGAKAGTRFIAAHRIGGYIFIALFCLLGYFMVARLGDLGASAPPSTMIHLTLAMLLSPLIFVKVLVARYYKTYYSLLMPIGLLIFVLSFVLIGITAGPFLAHRSRMQTVSLADIDLPPAAIDIDLAAETMEKRCSKCHTLDRIAGARKDARGWLTTVNRMRALPDSGISEADARIVVSWLASQMAPRGLPGPSGLEVARALVDQRCGRCHSLDRVYKTVDTPAGWSAIVAQMAGFAEGSSNAFQPGEDQQMVAYLSATQTPDAVSRRSARATAASPSGQSPGTPRPVMAPDPSAPRTGYDKGTIAFVSFVCLATLALIARRPAKVSVSGVRSDARTATAPGTVGGAAASLPDPALILRLASVTPQTADARTLRFIVPRDRKLNARPGQFLTFSFLFDGKRVVRSYSICSSTARSGYVEITPKRTDQGCVSVFLNDRASVGLTVEANGPFGSFSFDESRHRSIVLLAAGSGITPMMAMLRYIDDLCLDTVVTLLYCVRSGDDIIFRRELDELRGRLGNFRYHLLLSQPHKEWPGPRGHVSREFIADAVREPASSDFFLCGPPSFMKASRGILEGLGVKPERIMQESFGQESFGSSVPARVQPDSAPIETGETVEFVRSGTTCIVRSGQTLLEAAEEHGIGILSSCRQGQCGTCKTSLLGGTVRMDAEEGLDAESRAQGFVLTCVGRAVGPVKLDA
jgi:ferredoxin-NADP reductase